MPTGKPEVAVIMGSASDWETMKHAVDMLQMLGVPCERRIVSAHRTPELLRRFGRSAAKRGIRIIIAGAGGAAHLPGMTAANTWLPVLGVPIRSKALDGLDSLLSIAQMPAGIAVGTLAVGEAGAKNAGLLAGSIIAIRNAGVRKKLEAFRKKQTETVLDQKLP
jgi:phosphoribosylaminoimidazole carboxylase, PurE protein